MTKSHDGYTFIILSEWGLINSAGSGFDLNDCCCVMVRIVIYKMQLSSTHISNVCQIIIIHYLWNVLNSLSSFSTFAYLGNDQSW